MEVYARICRQCKETRPEFWYRSLRIKTCAQCEGWEPLEPVPHDVGEVRGAIIKEPVKVPSHKARKLAEYITPAPPWRFTYKAPKCRDCEDVFTPERETNVRCPSCVMHRREKRGERVFLRERYLACATCGGDLLGGLRTGSHALRKYCSNKCKRKKKK